MDYVNVKQNMTVKKKNYRFYFILILFAVLLVGSYKYFKGSYGFKIKPITYQSRPPELRFYEVLVNKKSFDDKSLPYLLELGLYAEKNDCQKIVKSLKGSSIREFQQGGSVYCQVVLGPYASVNLAYRKKLELASKGYNAALINNYRGDLR